MKQCRVCKQQFERLALNKTAASLTLRKDIENALNRVSAENGSNTPDFILAGYLMRCLEAFDLAVTAREMAWHGRETSTKEQT